MNDFVKRMIIEHKELCEKIKVLHDDIYNEDNKDSKVDFANKSIQLNAMKTYANALECRINNQNVFIDEYGRYMSEVNTGEKPRTYKVPDMFVCEVTTQPPVEKKDAGSDKDIDKQ